MKLSLPVLISSDCGGDPDDHWTLAHLALAKEFDVRLVVSSHVPGFERSAEYTAVRARETASFFSEVHRPEIVTGSNLPLLRGEAHPSRELDGARAIARVAREYGPSRRLVVVLIGPATDVALALKAEPDLADRIEIVSLGFESWPGRMRGWNVKADPEAWRALLDSPVPITLATLDVARRDLTMSRDEVRRFLAGSGPLGAHLANLFEEWTRGYSAACIHETGAADRWPTWDVSVVAHLLGMAETETVAANRESKAPLRVVRSVDTRAVRGHFRATIAASRATRPSRRN